MGALGKSFRLAMTGGCQACGGTGKEAHYIQGADVMRGRKIIAGTRMTMYRTCTSCGGSGKK